MMKTASINKLCLLIIAAICLGLPLDAAAQRRRPVRRTVRRTTVAPLIPVGTDLKIRINETLSSKDSRVGDRFTATVIDPSRFDEARLEGHVASIRRSGTVQGRTSMNLAFDSIQLSDGRREPLHGYVTRVYGSDSGRADNEGGIESSSR